jgi:hypothetical protein
MVAVIIFYLHVIFLIYIFTKNLLDEGRVSAFLSVIFIVIIFSVGWTISEFAMSMVMDSKGLGLLLPRYAFSLTLLTVLELILYKFYFSRKKITNP